MFPPSTDAPAAGSCPGPEMPDRTAAQLRQVALDVWSEATFAASILQKALPSAITERLPALRDVVRTPVQGTFENLLKDIFTQPAGGKDKVKSDWTVALNLTTDFDGDSEGKFYRLEDLKEYAAKTKGTGLTIVVQAAFKVQPENEGDPPTYALQRYVVRNGQIKQVLEGESKGYGQDVEDLVAYTAKNYPATRTALIMDSHGLGNEGLFGDTGQITVDDFVKRVQNGLKGSGRERLDLVHFDSCYMAQDGVAARVSQISEQMVASSEAEAAEGISLIPVFESLREKPNSGPRELGRVLVNEARIQLPGFHEWGMRTPIETISNINLKEYAAFNKSLDKLGDKLADYLKDSNNLAVIETAIDASKKFGRPGSVQSLSMNFKPDKYRVDLKNFVENIIQGIEDGTIKDDDRELKRCAQEVLEQRSKLVDASFGEGRHLGHGGISVFLPGRDMRDIEREARLRNSAGRLSEATSSVKFTAATKDEAKMKAFVENANMELALIRPVWFLGVRGVDDERKAVEAAVCDFQNAKTDSDRKKAFDTIHSTSSLLESAEPFKRMQASAVVELRKNASKLFTAQLDDGGKTGWSRFRKAVSRQ